ncbi:hypothetical protein LCL86_12735 [Muricauda ruestringensis]|jgi:hypothetical protein|uniref:hypothetical protein n=1 Tax=Flavobacteriaceae TaxID=49546 RepID=UPI001CD2CCFE|nr:hypothetical protein [Allomuricauda ruestringensis]MCA0959919.1 hypothetical protein [Allomuricauda ruestringensis]
MDSKSKYYFLLKKNNGLLNEIDLGEQIGLDTDETQIIISQLLSEHRIEYVKNKASNYRIIKKRKTNKK